MINPDKSRSSSILEIGRPVFVAAIDANTSLCLGYSLVWEGGVYSLQNLLLNIISDKKELCQSFGIHIEEEQWPNDKLPGTFITDRGTEYIGNTFEQIVELGVTLTNLDRKIADSQKNTLEITFP